MNQVPVTEYSVREWGYRRDDGRMPINTTWRDDRGKVELLFSYSAGDTVGVVYKRGKTTYQLGDRRWHRDFVQIRKRRSTRSGLHPSVTEDSKNG